MPQLEYAVLADYVRQDGGTIHIMAAGLDTFTIPAESLPVAVPVGLAVRITFSTRDPVGELHAIGLAFSGPPGDLLRATQQFPTPPPAPDIPESWRPAVGIAIRTALPFPAHGNYALEVTLDDDPLSMKRLDLRAIPPTATT